MSRDGDVQDIAAILSHYGADMLSTRDRPFGWHSIRCPFHNDNRASGRISIEVGAFACLACGIKGDAIGIIRQQERLDYVGAVAFYERVVGKEIRGVSESVQRQQRGFDLLGEPRSYEGNGGGISRWLRRSSNEG